MKLVVVGVAPSAVGVSCSAAVVGGSVIVVIH